MVIYVIYGIVAVMAVLITRYSVPIILSAVQIPYKAVLMVNFMLNVAIFAVSFFVLNFATGFIPTNALKMPFSPATSTSGTIETPRSAAAWTLPPELRSEPTWTFTQTRRLTSTRTSTPALGPQVFGDIRRGKICRNSCYDYGSTVEFCFWSNFNTNEASPQTAEKAEAKAKIV